MKDHISDIVELVVNCLMTVAFIVLFTYFMNKFESSADIKDMIRNAIYAIMLFIWFLTNSTDNKIKELKEEIKKD